MDIKRNKLPACAWLRLKSFSIVKSKGEKISRERKLKNTIPAKKKIGVMLEKKSFCSGLAIIFLLFRHEKLKINISILMNLRLQGHF
jgi:glucosamine 6-phosphate synthetase-like amidotransferase/phosphosugar isomerase protein